MHNLSSLGIFPMGMCDRMETCKKCGATYDRVEACIKEKIIMSL